MLLLLQLAGRASFFELSFAIEGPLYTLVTPVIDSALHLTK